MSTIWELFVKFEKHDIWIVLYLLDSLPKNVGAKSKYIAKLLEKPSRQVVAALVKLNRLGLLKKKQTLADGYPTHWWFISEEGKDLLSSRIHLDPQGHFQTLQRVNKLPQPLVPTPHKLLE
ncbi:MAG: hypothetical protein V7L11_01720 [Nostoc sp.]|uniref:hypothetical protein n=1 Tax=Nostoc sp. TaxID=1180 RepID=UPI002FFA7079